MDRFGSDESGLLVWPRSRPHRWYGGDGVRRVWPQPMRPFGRTGRGQHPSVLNLDGPIALALHRAPVRLCRRRRQGVSVVPSLTALDGDLCAEAPSEEEQS